jgi:hypothetical protein
MTPIDAEDGVRYSPFTNGAGIGVRADHPDGRTEYVYLVPSTGDSEGQPNVFVYSGTAGDPNEDGTVCYVNVFEASHG